jgi:hypothetical protein
MIEIRKYSSELKTKWDELITTSKNGTFLFYRDYMDYHSERFLDHSFLIYKKGKIEAVLPGNIKDDTYYSHLGLTYGGLLLSRNIVTGDVLNIFKLINANLKHSGIKSVIYKPTPYIYHLIPSQEDIYALYKMNATKIGCNLSSTIYQGNKISFIESRKSGIRKSKKEGIRIEESNRFELFWSILNDNLINKFGTPPVHTIEEIKLLHRRFPENIKLYISKVGDEVLGGCVLFKMTNLIHIQYISASETGKAIGALDLLFDELINKIYPSCPVFDFGQSTEQMGNYLNENLLFQKEGFGGRGTVYEIYQYQIS